MRIFLSYARADSLLCESVATALQSVGHEVVRDVTHTTPGGKLSDRIMSDIRSSDAFMVLITEGSRKSGWVSTEMAWALDNKKSIIPIIQKGVDPGEIPAFPSGVEYIEYDPANYQDTLDQVRKLSAHRAHASTAPRGTYLGNGLGDGDIELLGPDEVRKVFWIASPESRRPLEEHLQAAIREIIYQFLTTPTISHLLNIGALKTDDFAVILRLDTLHSLLRAVRQNKPAAMRLAGYEAGVLYGVGILRWFLAKTSETRGRAAIPGSVLAVIEACLEIDRKAGLGKEIKVSDIVSRIGIGWTGKLQIVDHFLASDDVDPSTEGPWVEGQRRFWQGYFEGAFSAALGTWYGLIAGSPNGTVEAGLFAAQCTEIPTDSTSTLQFELRIAPPNYQNTYLSLQRELFTPHMKGDLTRVVTRARTVVDEFLRELAEMNEDTHEDIVGGLSWLGRTVTGPAKESVARLSAARNQLHKGVHVSGEPTEKQARNIVRLTAGSVLMACRDISLDQGERGELRRVLSRQQPEGEREATR